MFNFFQNLIICCLLLVKLNSSEDIFSRRNLGNKIIISLGIRCLPAMQLKKHGLRLHAYPFDWLDTSFDSLVQILKNDFVDFLAESNLRLTNENYVLQTAHGFQNRNELRIVEAKYNIILRHDFDINADFLKQYSEIKKKYEKRIKRFYEALSSGKHIYFIRRLISRDQALNLTALLNSKFPELKYTLIAIDYTNEIKKSWDISNVRNFYFGNPEDDWGTLVADNEKHWDTMFREFGFLD